MECPVCLIEWSSESCVPRMLNCGHTFCEKCLRDLYNANSITCPNCMHSHPFASVQDVDKLIKNYTLLSLASATERLKAQN